MLCALGLSDLAKCREIRCQMSDSTEGDPSTRYLLYKVALKCQDAGLGRPLPGQQAKFQETTTDFMRAAECLESISKERPNDSNLLYACVLEAQKNGDRRQVIRALSQVLEKAAYQATPGLQLPSLLRCVAKYISCVAFPY